MPSIVRLGLLLSCALVLQGQSSYDDRLALAEKVVERFYRGESVGALRERSNREIEAFNARTRSGNAEMEKAKARLEEVQRPAQEAYARLQEMDQGLKDVPDGNDQEGNKRYRERLDKRNAQARKVNELNAQAKAAVEAYNAQVTSRQGALDLERQQLLEAQKALDGRIAAYDAFTKNGEDVAFFRGVNRLLADLRQSLRRASGDPGLQKALARVRALRRELATWAEGEQARQSNGLIVVEALAGDEPVWLIVDSGAQDVVLPLELVEALDLKGALGAEDSLVVVGGMRLRGRSFLLPEMAAGGETQKNVRAYVVPASDVGIDGLLGQTFLKSFVYTIDEDQPGKLLLRRRGSN
jgi:hypothetical protein